jgi:hypothetical protein
VNRIFGSCEIPKFEDTVMGLRRMRLLPKYCKVGVRTPPSITNSAQPKKKDVPVAEFTKYVCSVCGHHQQFKKRRKRKKIRDVCAACRAIALVLKGKTKNRKKKPAGRRAVEVKTYGKVTTSPVVANKPSKRKTKLQKLPAANKVSNSVKNAEAAKTKRRTKRLDVRKVPAWAPGCDTCD